MQMIVPVVLIVMRVTMVVVAVIGARMLVMMAPAEKLAQHQPQAAILQQALFELIALNGQFDAPFGVPNP